MTTETVEKARESGVREATHVEARCPFRLGTPDRAAWLDGLGDAILDLADAAGKAAAPAPAPATAAEPPAAPAA